jgi:transcriptional regulator with XRE-family HTH domain
MAEFKDRLKELREEKGLKQSELASKFTVTAATISMWENGKTEPSIANLKLLAEMFNCTVHYLVGATDNKEIEKKDLLADDGKKVYEVTYDRTRFDDDEQLKKAVSEMVKQAMEEQSHD